MTITGECFCGTVKYEINGELRDARSCHCSRCRKVFSSQASAYALVAAGDFTWISGEDNLTNYISEQNYGFQFCKSCGSTLTGVYQGEVHGITLGCLNGSPDIEISRHIFVDSKATWEVIPEGVTQYEGPAPEVSS